MKTARVRIQVIKVIDFDVEVEDDATQEDAITRAYNTQTTDIQELGDLQDVETDHAEFQRWVD